MSTATSKKLNEIATQGPRALSTEIQAPTQSILSTDILLPKLLLMQGLSDLVAERKAQMGDFVRSTTKDKLGEAEKDTIDFIPLKVTMEWTEQEKIGQKFEFRRTIERNANNEHAPWSFFKNPQGQEFDKPGSLGATEWRRVKVINVYALLPKDVDAFEEEMKKDGIPDVTKTILPIVISFRSTSFNAGKLVTTFFAQVAEMRRYKPDLKHYDFALPLSAYQDKNEKGTFYVLDVGKPKQLDPKLDAKAGKYREEAERWYNTLSNLADIKVDESGESETVPAEGTRF